MSGENHGDDLTRREILQRSALVGAGCILAGSALAGCESSSAGKAPKPQVTSGLVSLGAASDVPAGTVSTSFLETYGIVLANESGTVVAIRPICTHRGCLANWQPSQRQFVCPCHGSRYDILGRVLHGPALESLPIVPTLHNPDGTLAIDLDRLYGRPG